MKHISLFALLLLFCCHLNAQRDTRVQRNDAAQANEALISAKKAFNISHERFKEAIELNDSESRKAIKQDLLHSMRVLVSENKPNSQTEASRVKIWEEFTKEKEGQRETELLAKFSALLL